MLCYATCKVSLTNGFRLLLFLLLSTLLEVSPAPNALVSSALPALLMLSLSLTSLEFLISLLLLSTLFLHLRLHLPSSPMLIVNQHHLSLLSPVLGKLLRLHLLTIYCPLILADQQHACISDCFVQPLAVLLIHQLCLCLLEPVERIRGRGVLGLIGMDQERFRAVAFLDIRFRYSRLEVQDSITVKTGSALAAECPFEDIHTHLDGKPLGYDQFRHPIGTRR